MLRRYWYLPWNRLPEPKENTLNAKTAKYLALHIAGVVIAVASAVLAAGPQKIEDLFSHDPVKVTISAAGLIVAVAGALGAAKNGNLFTQPQTK